VAYYSNSAILCLLVESVNYICKKSRFLLVEISPSPQHFPAYIQQVERACMSRNTVPMRMHYFKHDVLLKAYVAL